MDIVSILSIAINLGILVGLAIIYRKIKNAVTVFVEAPDENTPSPLAQTVDQTAEIFVRRAVDLLGMHDKAQGSAAVRRENAIDTAMVTDLMSGSSPVGAILMSQFPNLAKKLAKNPALIQYLLPKLQGLNLGGGGNGQTKTEEPLTALNLNL